MAEIERTQIMRRVGIVNEDHVGETSRIYMEALNAVGSGGWSGAKIYDALLLRCAARCMVERVYTFNLGDFKQLAPASCAP